MNKRIAASIFFLLLPAAGWAGEAKPALRMERASVEVSGAQDLERAGWEQVSAQVWRTTLDNGAAAEVAFGAAAFERAAKQLDELIGELRALDELTGEQELRLFESLVRRDQLAQWYAEASTSKLTETGSRGVCWGSAQFEHSYGFSGFVAPAVESDTLYTEFGPLSGGTKTAFARARVCGDGTYCVQNTDSNSIGSSFSVAASASASVSPFFGCTANAFGYVLVLEASGCTDLASFSTSHTCTEFFHDPI
jgi:hypothetical protein